MNTYIDLNRRFIERPKYVPDELITSEISGKRLDWANIQANRFSVIVAPANYGKTIEMRQRAVQMRVGDETAFFVELRKVAERQSLEQALSTEEYNVFKAWKVLPINPLTVFVDSLDEAFAGKPDDIEYLFRQVADALQWPNTHIRWVISTRPAMLSLDVMTKLNSVLVTPFQKLSTSVSIGSSTTIVGEAINQIIASGAPTESDKLRLYSMAPLDQKQAEFYLSSKYPDLALNVAMMLRIAHERGLTGFCTSPGGLGVIAHIDLISDPPESLTEVFQRVADAVQQLQNQDHRIEDAGSSPVAELKKAAQKIASASLVCQLPNIEIPEEKLGVTEGVLSARLIASSLLTDKALRQLLGSQLFIDSGQHQVKLYPDELLPFLAAQRLSGLVQSPERAHKLVEVFSWCSPTGEQGVYRQFLPLMGWLATLNQHCREEILKRDPQAIAFFGDLRNSNMPLTAAEDALRASVRRLAEKGDSLGRGFFILTSENYWQAGGDRLRTILRELYQKYGKHYHVRNALLDIVINARTDALRDFVLEEHGGDYNRLIQQSIDVQYLVELGVNDDLAGLAHAVKFEATVNESLIFTLIKSLGWSYFTPKELADLIYRQFERGRGGFHISYILGDGLLDEASDLQLFVLSRFLVLRAARFRNHRGGSRRHHESTDDRYLELVLKALAVLINRVAFAEVQNVALLCLIMQRVIIDDRYFFIDVSNFRQALQNNPLVRRLLLSLIVKYAGKDSQKLSNYVYAFCSICVFNIYDVEAINVAELTVASKKQDAFLVSQKVKQDKKQRVPKPREDRLKIGTKNKKELFGILEKLRDGSATNGLIWAAAWLSQTNPNSRYGEIDINLLKQAAGQKIAQAIREGFSKVWRTRQPTYNEDTPNTIFYITIAGLQGLHIELASGKNLPHLTDDEVINALRYGLFEINGYPKWFWPLVQCHESVAGIELLNIVKKAKAGAVSFEHASKLLTAFEKAPKSLQIKFAPQAWVFIQEYSNLTDDVLDNLLKVVTRVSGVVNQAEFEDIAWSKMGAAFSDPVSEDKEEAGKLSNERNQSVIWASCWLLVYPLTFHQALEKWLERSPENAKSFIFEFAAYLGNDRGTKLLPLAKAGEDGVNMLGALYELTIQIVRPEDDNDHTDGEAYSPNQRDDAEKFRDALIRIIASAQSQRAYEVLDRLRLLTESTRAIYLQNVQFEMREAQYSRAPIAQQKYNDFEREFMADVTDTTSFAMAVHTDLLAVKYDIEKGEYSLRRFFSELNFDRVKSDKSGLALEADFQSLLARELNHLSKGSYSVTLESQTAEAKRRDVLCRKDSMYASIELKMSQYWWTVETYIEALEKQLVGQYMRDRNATTGFLVIVLQKKGRTWVNPETGNNVDFEGLLKILREKALALESKDRMLFLRVIGIDATSPQNFRTEKKIPPKKGSKSAACRR